MFSIAVRDDNQIKPSMEVGDIGGNSTFTCQSSGNTSWFFNDLASKPILVNSAILTLFPVNYGSIGLYYCFGRYIKKKKIFLASANLVVGCKFRGDGSCGGHTEYTTNIPTN